jgi:hypothetical protein
MMVRWAAEMVHFNIIHDCEVVGRMYRMNGVGRGSGGGGGLQSTGAPSSKGFQRD